MSKVHFYEKQRFTQWWLWLILGSIFCLIIGMSSFQLITGEPIGNKPASDFELILVMVLYTAFIVFFWRMHLTVKIAQGKIGFQFWPFVKKEKAVSEIVSYTHIDRGVVVNQGIRMSKDGWVYSVKGGDIMQIVFVDGSKWNIGTNQPKEFEAALATLIKS